MSDGVGRLKLCDHSASTAICPPALFVVETAIAIDRRMVDIKKKQHRHAAYAAIIPTYSCRCASVATSGAPGFNGSEVLDGMTAAHKGESFVTV